MAEHELRAPLGALALAAESCARRPGRQTAMALESQLERAQLGLADLAAARSGRRAPARVGRLDVRALAARTAAGWRATGARVRFDWRAGGARVDADGRRISQALANLISNALEHGGGRAELRGFRNGKHVRIEVADSGPGLPDGRRRGGPGRGRGLAIASRAVEDAGGSLALSSGPDGTVAAVELPLADK
jgi:signal transduction histidine kinase